MRAVNCEATNVKSKKHAVAVVKLENVHDE